MTFVNNTSIIGNLTVAITNDITGSLFLTLLVYLIILSAIMIVLNIPVEFIGVFIVPLTILGMAYGGSQALAFGGILLIYLGGVFAKNFFIKD